MAPAKGRKRTGKARQVRRTYYDNVVGAGDLAGLSSALEDAKRLLAATRLIGGDAEVRAERAALAEAEVEKAKAALDEHRDRIWFEPIPAVDLERMRLAHPPQSDVKPGEVWSYIAAVIAACAVDSDDTEEDWQTELAGWSVGDRNAIWQAASACNNEPASLNLGKD